MSGTIVTTPTAPAAILHLSPKMPDVSCQMAPAAVGMSPTLSGKRKKVATASEPDSSAHLTKKTKQSNQCSSTTRDEVEEDVELEDVKDTDASSVTTTSPATTPSSTTSTVVAYSSIKDKKIINTLLRQPLPNVLADMITEYLFHPQFDLWEEIISAYESLPQMIREGDKTTKKELMPRLQLAPPASPMEVDELEQQFQLKYREPNFQFSSELKFLWSIADGLEAPQNMIFRGRFWPSLANMRSILACPENSYYVVYHYHCQHNSAWLKYDFRSGAIYSCGCHEDQVDGFVDDDMIITFHSMTHFLRALLSHLKLAFVDARTYRLGRGAFEDIYALYGLEGDPHPPALRLDQTRSFVPKPEVDLPFEWDYLLLGDCQTSLAADALIPGHLTSSEYLAIRKSVCAHENEWVERLLIEDENRHRSQLWHENEKHLDTHRQKESTNMTTTTAKDGDEMKGEDDDGDEGQDEDEDEEQSPDESSEDDSSVRDRFPIIASCHLLDAFDNYEN